MSASGVVSPSPLHLGKRGVTGGVGVLAGEGGGLCWHVPGTKTETVQTSYGYMTKGIHVIYKNQLPWSLPMFTAHTITVYNLTSVKKEK